MESPAVTAYIQLFKGNNVQQGAGADFPVFVGSRSYQYGTGIGDILRGAFRWILPVVARGASTFLSNMVSHHDAGHGWKDAAKSSILPALSNTAEAIGQAAQSGRGHKRKKQYKRMKSKKTNYSNWNF